MHGRLIGNLRYMNFEDSNETFLSDFQKIVLMMLVPNGEE